MSSSPARSDLPTSPEGRPVAEAESLPKAYVPTDAEAHVWAKWQSADAFHADCDGSGDPFSIVIPPPNVTAALHLGHALNNTLQDVLTRFHRMRGCRTLWMPGTDHAGIATQTVVEKRLLATEGKRRTEYGRDDFVARVQTWKDEYETTILSQLREMGASCDFDRTRFTMDPVCAAAVREAFFILFRDGLIERGKRLVNWDPVTQTALADDEVEMEEVAGHMWFLRYPLKPDPNADASAPTFVTVATTRPETMLGDTAVAVNPRDPRAAALRGRTIILPIVGREIPIVEDDYVVMPVEFGGDASDAKAAIATGFLKVTPAHDPNDWEIGVRHGLPAINVMAPDATISDRHGWSDISETARAFVGLSREEARTRIVAWFRDHDLLEGQKAYVHSVGHSYRSHVPIEPYLSDQWYVRVTDDRLKGAALRAMAEDQYDAALATSPRDHAGTEAHGDGELHFFPPRYAKTFQLWHENLRDWCISRQLWWGHRIPVWHKRVTLTEANWSDELLPWGWDSLMHGDGGAIARLVRVSDGSIVEPRGGDALMPVTADTAGEYDAFVCVRDDAGPDAGHADAGAELERHGFARDPDVLDTWFSSALWPMSTMGWPDPDAFPQEIPEGSRLLETFNPSSVLCTAREIITLWVSRMVMFNRYLRSGTLPFRHVFIHAMIQDGFGQKMSKSLGNGVDPRDIIHAHGADAMRFVMVQMTTQTQDVRLPVDLVCPHTGETFAPRTMTTPAGHTVAEPIQVSPKDPTKRMVSGYGAATGLAEPTAEMPLARNTSSRFDVGRNFCNKLWNASRFAMANLVEPGPEESPTLAQPVALVDRWMISRLHRALHAVEDALAEYQFSDYAEAMYDLVWRDFCDWYLEAIKPTVRSDAVQRQVLRTTLDAILRLLHPVCPFVTEAIWPHLADTCAGGPAGIEGVILPSSPLLTTAAWPDIACRVDDPEALETFARVQAIVSAIRNLRGERQVQPKRKIVLHAGPKLRALATEAGGVIETLAGLERIEGIESGHPPDAADAIPLPFEGEELFLSGLVDAVNADAERERIKKSLAELERQIVGFRNKLGNEGYVAKAPPAVVEDTRARLAKAEAEAAAARSALERL